ncbi:MAG: Fe-S-containing hydro-lyase [Dehalococcoidia bacterium]|nr:Fe-S-containing hydro-lyase [Dehalococcoidia bacterium]
MEVVRLTSPLTRDAVSSLKAGDSVMLSGVIYTARDAAHKKLIETLDAGDPLPLDIQGITIYYMGPSPAPPGGVIGAAGPTTSGRMDRYTPRMLAAGVRAMLGKGFRSHAVKEAIREHGAVYMAAIGGAGALISKRIKSAEVVVYPELGPEAIRRLEVEDLPAIVINDSHGGDLYIEGRARFQIQKSH